MAQHSPKSDRTMQLLHVTAWTGRMHRRLTAWELRRICPAGAQQWGKRQRQQQQQHQRGRL